MILVVAVLAMNTSGCDKEEPIEPNIHDAADVAGNVEIIDDVMTISDGFATATITAVENGYLATYGDFNVLINNMAEKDGNTVIGFTEYTSDDRLDVRIEILGYRHQRESYTRDGQTLTFEVIDDITDEQRESLVGFLDDATKINSVMDNADGAVLNALITENWDELTDETMHSADKRTAFGDAICNLATACVASKCWFGGLLNTLCGVCTSAVIACAIMDAFGWW